MAAYTVDREHLDSFSTEEIQRILKEELDDYTPEAIEIFHDILQERGVHSAMAASRPTAPVQTAAFSDTEGADMLVNTPQDAVRVLNNLLVQLLNGKLDPQVAHVAGGIVMEILRAKEQEFMTEPEEES